MNVRSAFDRVRVQTVVSGESRAKQQFKDECDINKIMTKFQKTGLISHVRARPGVYADVSESAASDYREALTIVIEAQNMFMSLPSNVRSKFDNDPAAFMVVCSNPDNGDEMIKLGLATAKRPVDIPPKAGGAPDANTPPVVPPIV